jgi:hypothetical protein
MVGSENQRLYIVTAEWKLLGTVNDTTEGSVEKLINGAWLVPWWKHLGLDAICCFNFQPSGERQAPSHTFSAQQPRNRHTIINAMEMVDDV